MSAPQRPFRRRVMINTVWTGVGTGWAIVVSLVTLPLTLRGLGSAAFGTWVLLNTFSAMTGWFSLADIGIGAAATREIAGRASLDDRAGAHHVISSAMTLFVVLGVGFATIFAAAGPFVLPPLFGTPSDLIGPLQFAIVVFAAQVVVDQASNAMQASMDGLQRSDLSRATDGIRRTLVAGGVAAAALAGGGLQWVAIASAAGSTVGLVVTFVILHRLERRWWSHRPRRADMVNMWAYGRTVAFLRPIGVIHRQMDRLIVGAILGPVAVTLVEIATQIQNGAEAILGASTYAVTPASSWIRAREAPDSLRELVLLGTKYSMLATLPVVVAGMLLAGPIVAVWVGPAQSAAAGLAALALAYTGVTCVAQVSSSVLVGIGRAGAVLRALVAAILINLVLSIVLVHAIGTAGAFLGTLAGAIFIVPFILHASLEEVGVGYASFVRQSVVPTIGPLAVLAVVIGGVVALPLGNLATIVVGGAAGGAAYLATAARFTLHRHEIGGLLADLRRGPGPATT